MSNYDNWKKEFFKKDASNKFKAESELRKLYGESNDQVNQATSNVDKIQEFLSLLSHRNFLRENTAYPTLRVINLINSIAIVLSFMILGGDIGHDEGIIIGGIAGVIVAILNYSLTSVFFDVADSNINTSRNSEGKS